jgi:hypothetical protein
MTRRYTSLDEAVADIPVGTPARGVRIVVNRTWWDELSEAERRAYRVRCDDRGVGLTADDRISRHFVELAGVDEPPLSSERRV